MSQKAGASVPFPHPLPVGMFVFEAEGAAAPADSDPTPDGGAPSFAPITSQEEFDRRVNDRLRREREKVADPSSAIVSKKHYEELKASAQRLAELEQANLSDLEREREARQKAEELAETLQKDARDARMRAALLAEAAKADRRIVDPDAAIALLDKSSLDLDDAGNPLNVAEAMDSLLRAKPYLVATNGGTRGNADQGARDHGGIRQITESELKTMKPEQIDQARREGRLNDLLGVR